MTILQENKEAYLDLLKFKSEIPRIIKYMGSKRELLGFITESINEIYEGESICDLFAGTSIVGGALGHSTNIYSNDIQEYSSVFAKTYLGDYTWEKYPNIVDDVVKMAENHVNRVVELYPDLNFDYENVSLDEFNALEHMQQNLISQDFENIEHHLFIKNYSGTYWSFEQCLWIDGLRIAAEEYSETNIYYPLLSSIMHAMAYNAQSTGHYAQYRDANNEASMEDIIIYRNKKILPFFEKKLKELINYTGLNRNDHNVTSLDYLDCLDIIPDNTIVYADPPYTFVHYSRFYHALETLVRYDYPEVLFKGRYRTDRHQSPFCKKTTVVGAFSKMFEKIESKKSKLVLSYSSTGMIGLDKIIELAKTSFGDSYKVYFKEVNYKHSTMGRSEDKSRKVKEYIIIATPI